MSPINAALRSLLGTAVKTAGGILPAMTPIAAQTEEERRRIAELKALRAKGIGLSEADQASLTSTLLTPVQAAQAQNQANTSMVLAQSGGGASDALRAMLGQEKAARQASAEAAAKVASADVQARTANRQELQALTSAESVRQAGRRANRLSALGAVLGVAPEAVNAMISTALGSKVPPGPDEMEEYGTSVGDYLDSFLG